MQERKKKAILKILTSFLDHFQTAIPVTVSNLEFGKSEKIELN